MMDKVIRLYKALSDENRVRMLKLLLERDIRNCEMQTVFPNLSQSQISRDLTLLTNVGCLERRREGRYVVYSVARKKGDRFCRSLLRELDNSFNNDEAMRRDKERLQRAAGEQP